MRVSYAWLKELLPGLTLTPEALSERLLNLGLEVASLERTGPAFTGVVIGTVVTKDKHPNADRLSVCTVSDGTASFPVVCGAPNVAAGQRVAFAKAGARLPGDFHIKKSKIRGAVSEGMICSTKELGLPDTGLDGIMVLAPDAPLGTDFASTLGPGDTFLDVEIPSNRADCLSHLGLARELAVNLALTVRPPAAAALSETGPAPLPVTVADPAACPRYTGRLVEGVTVGPSPDWLKLRLEGLGLRSINNVVDVTNLVLMELGQPLHAFDADKLSGGRLEVRNARPGETLKALDGKERALTAEDLVIADGSAPVALAGVIGGEPTGVTEATTRVFIECARFSPSRVRRAAKHHGLRTDSSFRFERGLDPAGQAGAAGRAAALIVATAGGRCGPLSDTAPAAPARPLVMVSAARINEILGTAHPAEAVEGVLRRLASDVRDAGPEMGFVPPSWRLDLATPQDLAEEAARHLGYDAIPEEISPARMPVPSVHGPADLRERLADALAGLGFTEAMTYDMVSDKEVDLLLGPASAVDALDRPVRRDDLARLLNPLSEDWAAMRPTLLLGLLKSARLNQNRGVHAVRLFEEGRVYAKDGPALAERARLSGLWAGPWPERAHWRRPAQAPDAHEVQGLLAALLRRWPVSFRPAGPSDGLFHPKASVQVLVGGRLAGRAGELHPETLRRWDLRGAGSAFELDLEALLASPAAPARYSPVSPFPAVERDLSLYVDEGLEYGGLEAVVRALGLPALARVELIDVYSGSGVPAGRKSWTLRFTFSLADRTLADADIKAAMDAVMAADIVKDSIPRT
ncbi:MAG: phenylalanine--tRNA ligase subunit beta [Elusimicrobia bacterium]|nr:phenylalanine--tRNA ligase subunit beta [Elusimicrobiota bacterium]